MTYDELALSIRMLALRAAIAKMNPNHDRATGRFAPKGGGGGTAWHGKPGAGNPGTPPASPRQAAIRRAAEERAASPGKKTGGVSPGLAAHGLKAKADADGGTTYSMPEGSKSITLSMARSDLENKGYKASQNRNVHVHANGTHATLRPQDNGDVKVSFSKPQ